MERNPGENKMGVMPIGKLLVTMSLPMMVSMLVQALYNIVDSVYVARLSEDALTAVSLAFPAQNLMIGFATGTAVGVNAILSRSLGEGNRDKARRAGENGVFLAGMGFLLFLVFGLFATPLFFRLQTDNKVICDLGVDYLSIVCTLSFGVFGQVIFERLLQSTGKTVFTLATQGVGAVINIILDPIFIFGYYGFPKLGIKGAALATVVGQIIAFIMAVTLNHRFNEEFRLKMRSFRPDIRMIGKIYSVGIPSIIMVGIGSVMTFSLNKILIAFTETAAAVFGVYFKLQSFVFMPLFGLNNGMIPIVAYNYGARKRERIVRTQRIALTFALVMMAIGLSVFQLMPERLLVLFEASENMLGIGIPALRTISLSFLFAGFSVVLIGTFQSFGKGIYSMFVSISRQLVVLIPCAYFLSRTGKLELVWWAFPIAEVASVTVAFFLFAHLYKNTIKTLDGEKNASL